MKKIFRLNLQAQIIFSFFIIISLSFVASYIATETIWQRTIDERNVEYRSKITKSVSDSLATYYQSWGSFDQGFENVLVREISSSSFELSRVYVVSDINGSFGTNMK